jgi:hypothetical protein
MQQQEPRDHSYSGSTPLRASQSSRERSSASRVRTHRTTSSPHSGCAGRGWGVAGAAELTAASRRLAAKSVRRPFWTRAARSKRPRGAAPGPEKLLTRLRECGTEIPTLSAQQAEGQIPVWLADQPRPPLCQEERSRLPRTKLAGEEKPEPGPRCGEGEAAAFGRPLHPGAGDVQEEFAVR